MFANDGYIVQSCQTPITPIMDPESSNVTCFQIEGAASGIYNFMQYLSDWTRVVNGSAGCSDPQCRPVPTWMMDYTTAVGSWMDAQNYELEISSHQVFVNNPSLALPHPSLPGAAKDPVNGVIQPQELQNRGSYSVRGSLPSPEVFVLCATLTEADLQPFVYALWEGSDAPVDIEMWPAQLSYADPYLKGTAFDDIFKWGKKYGHDQWPPVFPILPIDYNTIMNDTADMPYGRSTIYTLSKAGPVDGNEDHPIDSYALCQIQVGFTSMCSMVYNVSYGGATLTAFCGESAGSEQYSKSSSDYDVSGFVSKNWPNAGSIWADATGLNDGVYDGNSSLSRMLTEMTLTTATLNPALPSLAEGLGAVFGYSALLSAQDSPLVGYWNYSLPTLKTETFQYFNASIDAEEYASGGIYEYQKPFIIILAIVFVLNVVILVDQMYHRERFVDFSEPTALFWIAAGSPASYNDRGPRTVAPRGHQFRIRWRLKADDKAFTIYSEPTVEQTSEEWPSSTQHHQLGKPLEQIDMPFLKPFRVGRVASTQASNEGSKR
ncbi:hypothetical protein LTR85_010093 [Meristemomyces frigidus]|nr:hypothetical protein LTR85_010093 [Meristemomyces frigidus]